jgi:hypothetical protein
MAVATCLSGGEPVDAWPAVWALAASSDRRAKDDVLAMIDGFITAAVESDAAGDEALSYLAGEGSVTCRVSRRWQKVDQACAFQEAILQSLRPRGLLCSLSPEARRRLQAERDDAHVRALRRSGVQPGEGFPFWALYMTRRSKRSWGH